MSLHGSDEQLKAKSNVPPKMSDEVVDSNPYSRLMALKRMGIVENYEDIQKYTVVVVGMGGIGSITAEMLVRCGIGKLILFDYDKVEMANMNRLFYQPSHCGMYKVDAAISLLNHINPDTVVKGFNSNITNIKHFQDFVCTLMNDGLYQPKVDLVLCCVDNYQARMTVNTACNEINQVWIESGVSENAVSGHIQFIQPGKTGCYACVPPLLVASDIDEKSIKREGVCSASLPTTMGIIAGILVQNALKYLLKFGTVSNYVTYNALSDFFTVMEVMPSPDCKDNNCSQRRIDYQNYLKTKVVEKVEEVKSDNIKSENPYFIEIVEEGANDASKNMHSGRILPKSEESVDSLMKTLKNL